MTTMSSKSTWQLVGLLPWGCIIFAVAEIFLEAAWGRGGWPKPPRILEDRATLCGVKHNWGGITCALLGSPCWNELPFWSHHVFPQQTIWASVHLLSLVLKWWIPYYNNDSCPWPVRCQAMCCFICWEDTSLCWLVLHGHYYASSSLGGRFGTRQRLINSASHHS